MDMFLLFVVIFLCVMFGLGAGALTLSLLFRLMVRLAGDRGARVAELSRRDLEAEINAYDGTIAYLDSQLGRLLDELQARGLLENTCVIITSDHGRNARITHCIILKLPHIRVKIGRAIGHITPTTLYGDANANKELGPKSFRLMLLTITSTSVIIPIL